MKSAPTSMRQVRLGEVCEINPRQDGPPDKTSQVSFIPMPAVCEAKGIIRRHAARPFSEVSKGYTRFRNGDVIFAKITPCMENGKVAVARNLHGGMACGSTEFHVLRPSPSVLPEYIWSFLRRPGYRADAARHMTGAVGQRRVPEDYIRNTLIPLPPISEQFRIVRSLDVLSGYLTKARDEIAHLPNLIERYKKAILVAAFRGALSSAWRAANLGIASSQDFLEIRGRASAIRQDDPRLGRDERSAMKNRDEELATALDALDNDGDLPATWTWCGIGEVFGVYVGATPSRKEAGYWAGDISWVSSGEVAFCRISRTRESISAAGLRNASTRVHPRGTVLLGMIGEGKTRGQAAILDINACNNQNCAAIRVAEAGYPPEYLYWYFYAVYEQTRAAGSGNNQPALNKDRVQRLPFPLAPPEEAFEIVRLIKSYLDPLSRLESEYTSTESLLDRLDDRLVGKAFSGRLSLSDARAVSLNKAAAE